MEVTREQREAWLERTARSPFNLWLAAQIYGQDGHLDLDRLHAVAREYGIDRQAQYTHLNPGQQRMNIGNMLRRVVPKTAYEEAAVLPELALLSPLPPVTRAVRPEAIRNSDVRGLLIMHSQITDELRDREIIRTGNAPLGDYAELLFATAFGWALEGNSSSGHDATDATGLRYQIKARRLTARNASRQLSAIRRLPDMTFDFLAGALFDETYRVTRAILIPHAIVTTHAKRVEHTNSWRFMLEDRVWAADGIQDVTAQIAAAAEQI